MKILFFISVYGHGSGGHIHSLNHISQKISEQHVVKIITIGPGESEVIRKNKHFYKHLKFNGLNFFDLWRKILIVKNSFEPDIYHCFDNASYNVVRLIIPSNKYKIVLTKCGGKNPIKDLLFNKYILYPYVKTLIVFSLENLEWFKSHKKFKDTSIHLIPNRVKPLSINSSVVMPFEKKDEEFVFMRVCRISNEYKKSINDALNLIAELIKFNTKKVKLVIVGKIQDTQFYNNLRKHEYIDSGNLVLITRPEITSEASKMLPFADAVIGTGRGLMEGASIGKPILAIDKNGNIPVLLSENNFIDAFKTNFSERNTFVNSMESSNFQSILQMMNDKSSYQLLSEFSFTAFDKYFNLNMVSVNYDEVYMSTQKSKRNLFFDLPIILISLKNYYNRYNHK